MARAKPPEGGKQRSRPATTPEDREDELVSLAYDLAEEQLRMGQASSQTIQHFLKAGSTREKIEKIRLAGDVKLAQAKIEAMEAATKMDALYAEAIRAMSIYQGREPEPSDEEEA